MTLKSSSRYGATVFWLVAHTAEGATNKESLYRYFNQPDVMASSHSGIDAEGIADWVPRSRAAWTLRNGNSRSMNVEICFYAKATRAQWLSTGTVFGCKNPRQMIRNLAFWIVREAKAFGIPLDLLSVAEFRAGERGYCDHDTYTDATGDGSHWDVGEGFPWDVLAADIRAIINKEEDDMPNLYDLLNTRVGTNAYDVLDDWADQPGSFGFFLLNQRQDNDYIRNELDKANKKMDAILSKLNESGGPLAG